MADLVPNTYTSGPHMFPPYSLLGGPENIKYLFDRMMMLDNQAALDNQANARAWNALTLSGAQDAQVLKYMTNINAVISAQSGDVATQSQSDPSRTAAGDNLAAGVAPANRVTDVAGNSVAAGIAESVQTNVTTQVSALTQQMGILTTTVVGLAQSVNDSNASIAASLATMASALTALSPKGATS